jgi:uncharacterized protein
MTNVRPSRGWFAALNIACGVCAHRLFNTLLAKKLRSDIMAMANEAAMNRPEQESFSPEVARRLKTYVYRLIDPRNGESFYVGKGQGNRVFSHIRGERNLEGDDLDNKMKRIREIRLAGFEVAHVIHRHGMDEQTAFEVEAALMDAYPGLTNAAGGTGTNDYGAMQAKEIIRRYSAEPAVFKHKAVLISVNRTASEASLYEATRYAWKISKSKAEQAEVILPTVQGLIVSAFVADRWLEATAANFPGREDVAGRLGFEGREAPAEIAALYVGKRVPDEYRKRGAANPINTHGESKVLVTRNSGTKLRDGRNVFSYCLKRLVLLIMIGDFQNGETSRLSPFPRRFSGWGNFPSVPVPPVPPPFPPGPPAQVED